MYLVHVRPEPVQTATLAAAGIVLADAGKADPEVTYMPYVTHADGSILTEEESDALDRLHTLAAEAPPIDLGSAS